MKLLALALLLAATSGCAVVDFLDGKHFTGRSDYPSYPAGNYDSGNRGGGGRGGGGHGGH